MDESVVRALARWPAVPAVYGWLLLDRRGDWRLRTGPREQAPFERIGNGALREFISRNYASDDRGCWYFQNGPQRVYVRLGYAPRVWRLDAERLWDHCGRSADGPLEAWLDEEGSLILADRAGVGVLDDRDLPRAAEGISGARIALCGSELRLGSVASDALPGRFGFQREPRP